MLCTTLWLVIQRSRLRGRLRQWHIRLYDSESARSLASEQLLNLLAAGMLKYSDGSKPSQEDQRLYNQAEIKHARICANLLRLYYN